MRGPDHAPTPDCVVSFRHLLDAALADFLTEAGLGGQGLEEPLAELAVTLSRYREEGQALFPVAFLGEALGPLLATLGGGPALPVGKGPRTRETVQRALRQCAPLGQGRWWSLYFVLDPAGLAYGVFRADPFPLAETALERLRRAQGPGVRVAGVLQLAEDVVELRAREGRHRHLFLSGARPELTLPTLALDGLAQAATARAPQEVREVARQFFLRVFFEAMQAHHGALVAVLSPGQECGPLFTDAVLLESPLDVPACLARHLAAPDAASAADVSSTAQLLKGMMATDGITLLGPDGRVLGYNAFVRHPHPAHPPREGGVAGGARRRTFDTLCRWLGGELHAVLMRSQDGALSFERAGTAGA